jgi:hypothetical protein
MRRGAAGGQRLHALGPAHRQVQLAHQRVGDADHAVGAARRRRSAPRAVGHLPVDRRDRVAEAVGGFAHQRRVRRHADRELDGLAHAARVEFGDRAVDRAAWPPITTWPGEL